MAANSTERLHHSSGSDKPKPSRQGMDVPNGQAHTITPVLVTARGCAGAPSSREGCVRQARGADMRVAEGAVRPGLVARSAAAEPQLCTQYVQTADRHPRDFRPATLVVIAIRSRPLRQAEGHVHDCSIALCAHRQAASLEHIQHRDIFRKDLGDELMKSGLTAEGCEMPHQC
jgi:hypothetical protein